jgi:Rod binding domain-containing protein
MNLSVQSVAVPPLPASFGDTVFSKPDLQKALSLQPTVAFQALQTVSGNSALPDVSMMPTSAVVNSVNGTANHTDAEIKKAAQDFEAIFMRMLFKQMRNTVEKSGLLGSSSTMEFFESMKDEQMADQLASAGGIGVGKIIYEKLKQATEPHLKTYS